jgi:hypothetical protein
MREYSDMTAAILLANGLLYKGANHGETACSVVDDGEDLRGCTEGFDCEVLGFLDRDECTEILGSGESMELGGKLRIEAFQLGWRRGITYNAHCMRGFEALRLGEVQR